MRLIINRINLKIQKMDKVDFPPYFLFHSIVKLRKNDKMNIIFMKEGDFAWKF